MVPPLPSLAKLEICQRVGSVKAQFVGVAVAVSHGQNAVGVTILDRVEVDVR